jgi:hypothetical protein
MFIDGMKVWRLTPSSATLPHDDGILGHAGTTMAQLYVGKTSSKTVAYPMRLESNMSKTLEDLIRNHGASSSLIMPRLNAVNVFLISFAFMASKTSKVNPITNIKTLLNERLGISSDSLTLSWTVPGLRLVFGYSASSMWSSFSTTCPLMLSVVSPLLR